MFVNVVVTGGKYVGKDPSFVLPAAQAYSETKSELFQQESDVRAIHT